jgi:hypothetical protein
MSPHLPRAAVVLLALALAGCGTLRKPGFPRQSYNPSRQIKELESTFEKPDLIRKYYAMTNASEAEKKAARNEIITGRLALINLNYNQFVGQFSFTKQTLDATTDVTELGLNLATTVVGGASTKTVLGAISTGVTGTKLAIDKNFFYEKTVPVLITSMNAQRKEALLPIMRGTGKSTDEYPLAQGLSDLDGYYFAGTFIGALQAIQADAGNKEVKASQRLDAVRTTSFMQDDAGNILQTYWMPGQPDDVTVNAGHQDQIQKWLEEHDLKSVPIQTLITGDLFAGARKQAVKDLKIKPAE